MEGLDPRQRPGQEQCRQWQPRYEGRNVQRHEASCAT